MAVTVPVIVGPTCSAKTAVALELASLLPLEIVSADSRQVFRLMDIGTAKPTAAQRALIRHHFIDVVDPVGDFSAGRFGEEGRAAIDDILARGVTPLVVGGSGLYIRSLIDGLFEGPGADPEFRDIMEERLRRGDLPELVEELRRVDPASASRIDPTKPRRVVRALEVFHATGRPISAMQREQKIDVNFRARIFGLLWKRDALYARINARCVQMLKDGLMEEVRGLERRGYGRHLNALNTVGYREAFSCLHGEIGEDDMLRLFQQNSRRYAKRQMTWFRRDSRITWISVDEKMSPRSVAQIVARGLQS